MATRRHAGHAGVKIPSFSELMIPTIRALRELGGSGTNDEIYSKVAEIESLPESVLRVQHNETGISEVQYRLHWSRTYLKKYGSILNSTRGVWSLLAGPEDLDRLDPKEVVLAYRRKAAAARLRDETASGDPGGSDVGPEEQPHALSWEDELRQRVAALTPEAFERLAQRLLREKGFIQVEMTKAARDGGIAGMGIARVNGMLSFRVAFQCIKVQDPIPAQKIRDFRGAMGGRSDNGLFITTSSFTANALKEATREGVRQIDLIDGEQLVALLKELRLGVEVTMVESVRVDHDWLRNL